MKVEIIRSETIKPSTPTPQNLETIKLSLLDHIGPAIYIPVVLFYPNNNNVFTSGQISQTLKKSLSETLASFYPFAGKINVQDSLVECNDDGAQFFEAESDGVFSAVLEYSEDYEAVLKLFLPIDCGSQEAAVTPLLAQVTFFADGGGLALGAFVSHKLADAATVALFLKTWAATAVGNDGKLAKPDFESPAATFPPRNVPALAMPAVEAEILAKIASECVTRRFLFDKSNIAALKVKTGGGGGATARPPTRVEAVTALLWKCAAAAVAAAKPRSAVVQAVNMRTRVEPPFPANTAMNLFGFFMTLADRDTELHRPGVLGDFAAKLRRGMEDFVENVAKKLLRGDRSLADEVLWPWLKEGREIVLKGREVDVFVFSSWCNFGFYEIDFGFGKPMYVTNVHIGAKDMFVLMDTRDGDGVEACLTLTKQNMASFESDSDLLEFVSSGFYFNLFDT